jgi:hypothetical protein
MIFCRESMAYLLDDDIYLSTEEEGSILQKHYDQRLSDKF